MVTAENGFFCSKCGAGETKARADPCAKCHKELVGNLTKALGKVYHKDCFVCERCSQKFVDGAFVDVNGRAMCENCA